MTKLVLLFCCLFFSAKDTSKKIHSLPKTKIRMEKVVTVSDDPIYNAKVLENVFLKLQENEKKNNHKIRVVHIGDSHIQSDLMTNQIRKDLQQQFGNAGRGLVFPYQLAKTNGSYNERFHSNRSWESYRNIQPVKNHPVGLSGIALWRNHGDFVVELNVKDPAYTFNTIRIITPQNQNMFDLATNSKTNLIESSERKISTHKIKKGEALSTIADKYNVSIVEIKRDNHLKSNAIRAGRTLKIRTNETKPKTISRSEFVSLGLQSDTFSHYYSSEKALDKIFLIPNKEASKFELNGIVLEKEAPGLIYSSIGVNGSKFSDYNKYPLFFEQLKALDSDLMIISLGTNESYDHMDAQSYIKQLRAFISNVKEQNPGVAILVMTPPPSLLKGKRPNTFIGDYAKQIIEIAKTDGFAVWDLYDAFGGINGIYELKQHGLIGPDWVHYSKKGYEKQGNLFAQAFLKTFNNFKSK